MKISVELLKENNACSDQVTLFEKTFGQSATVTKETCLKAAAVDLDFDWASRLLSRKGREAYKEAVAPAQKAYDEAAAAARKAYDEADAAAWKAYKEAVAPAQKAYDEAAAAARKAYDEAEALAWRACREATAPAWKAYKEAKTLAFWRASKL